MNLTKPANFRPPRAAYVHIPFCISKCHYCEFSSYPGMDAIFGEYVQALVTEIQAAAESSSNAEIVPLDSIYFGGGTPTILPSDYLADILEMLRKSFRFSSTAEINVEANPGTIDEAKLRALKNAGFNRLSLGVQSLDDDFLKRIGRIHTVWEAVDSYQTARRVGFENVSIDLMFALPGQDLAHWKRTLAQAIDLHPEHISLYELTVEEGTRFAEMCARGELSLPDEDAQIEMYEHTTSELASAGYEHYEVSNYARPGFRSRHNQVYWRNEPYYGFGAGATSYVNGDRCRRIAEPSQYIASICSESDSVEFSEHLTGRQFLGETIIQGLRMLDGVDIARIDQDYCTDISLDFEPQIAKLTTQGLLEIVDGRLRVTHRGLLLLNIVSQEFLTD